MDVDGVGAAGEGKGGKGEPCDETREGGGRSEKQRARHHPFFSLLSLSLSPCTQLHSPPARRVVRWRHALAVGQEGARRGREEREAEAGQERRGHAHRQAARARHSSLPRPQAGTRDAAMEKVRRQRAGPERGSERAGARHAAVDVRKDGMKRAGVAAPLPALHFRHQKSRANHGGGRPACSFSSTRRPAGQEGQESPDLCPTQAGA